MSSRSLGRHRSLFVTSDISPGDRLGGRCDARGADRAALRVGRFTRGSGFGSLRLDYEGARVLVSWQGRPPAGLVSLAQQDLRGVDVVLENVTYSAAEIVEPWEGSEQELARIAGVPVTVIVIRPDQAPQPLEGD